MKKFKKILKIMATIFTGALLFASCGKVEERAYLKIGADARAVINPIYEVGDFDNLRLSGIKGTYDFYNSSYQYESDPVSLGTFNSYSDLTNAYVAIPSLGKWKFTLTATKGSTIFENSVEKDINSGSNSVYFNLSVVNYGEEGEGNFEVGYKLENMAFEVYSEYDYEYIKNPLEYDVSATLINNSTNVEIAVDSLELELLPQDDGYGVNLEDYDRFGYFDGTRTFYGDFVATYRKEDIPAGTYRINFSLSKGTIRNIKTSSVVVTVTDGKTSFVDAPAVAISSTEIQSGEDSTTFTINYNLDGGSFNSYYVAPGSYNSRDEEKTLLPVEGEITKRGYSFLGWMNESGEFVTEIVQGNEGEVNLFAEWEIITYSITFNIPEASDFFPTAINYTVEEDVYLSTPTMRGYSFYNWYTTEEFEDGTEFYDFSAGEYVEDLVLYGKFGEIRYSVSYSLDGGELPADYEDAVDYFTVNESLTLPTPTKRGYTFAGWYTSEYFDYWTSVSEISVGTTQDYTVYARWDIINYSITYNIPNEAYFNNGTTFIYTVEEDVYLPTPTMTGYSFYNWYTTEELEAGTEFYDFNAGEYAEDLVLYGKFGEIRYSVTYNLNDGNLPSEYMRPVDYYTVNESLTLPTPTKRGYTFAGWYTSEYFDNWTSVSEISVGTTQDYTVYAKWEINNYTINYNSDYGVVPYDVTTSYTILDSLTLPVLSNTSSIEFIGWYTTSNWEDGVEVTEIPLGSTGDVTLYARWENKAYSITYNWDGGSAISYEENFSGYKLVELPIPTRSGYTFAGWYTTSEFDEGTEITEIESGISADVEVWAKWIALEPEVWVKTSTNGSYYFTQSGNVWTSNNQNRDNTTATTTWTITLVQEATVSIPWSVHSEANYDKLTITLDDSTKVNAESGSKNNTITQTLSAGTHTLVATYSKDSSQSTSPDCGTLTLNPVTYN